MKNPLPPFEDVAVAALIWDSVHKDDPNYDPFFPSAPTSKSSNPLVNQERERRKTGK
jgi:hypothetical protein